MRAPGGLKTGLFVLVLAFAVFQIGALVGGVAQQVDRLSKANAGDGLWHLSQVEVDYRRLTTALAATKGASDFPEVRHRFDLFFSRVQTLREGEIFSDHRTQLAFTESLSQVIGYLNSATPYIDGDDAMLSRELEMLISDTQAIDAAVRQLAISGVMNSSQSNETLRNDTRDILLQLFAATMALIVGLVLLVVVLRRLYQKARRISDENKLARARIASMIHASLDGMLVAAPDGRLLEMNRAAERMFQVHLNTQNPTYLSDLIQGTTDDGTFRDPAQSGLLALGRVQTQATRQNGDVFPAEISLVQAKLEKRSDVYVAYVRDISSRLEAESSLRQARDDAQAGEKAKDRLLAVMSHEIRTPLNGMLGAADLLSKTNLDETQNCYVGAMQTSGSILERHVNDVLELSRLDGSQAPRQLTPVNLHRLVPEIVKSQRAFAEQSETTLNIRVLRNVPKSVMGDQLALQQVLLNLVGNAIKFTPGGTVSVEVDLYGQGDVIEFRVIDDGIGISEQDLSKVFEDFYASDTTYARRRQGTGLGLGITKRIVSAMGGEIGAESIPEEGSLFWFRLPMSPVNAVSIPEVTAAKTQQSARPSEILLVEDNAINRMIASDMLQNAGHRVSHAVNGVEGVSAARDHRFDLILMDISMPDMDGLTAADKIRHSEGASRETPIVALTAQSMSSSDETLQALGISQVLQKPLTSQSLYAALEAVLAGSDPANSPVLAAVADQVLDTEILDDVIANIGVSKTRKHFEDLQQDMRAYEKSAALQVNGPASVAPTAHHLAGAAAVLGLCALYKSLSTVDSAGVTASPDASVHKDWQSAQTAFIAYLENFSTQGR